MICCQVMRLRAWIRCGLRAALKDAGTMPANDAPAGAWGSKRVFYRGGGKLFEFTHRGDAADQETAQPVAGDAA